MIQLMTSGGFKVFAPDGHFIGAYNSEKLAMAIDQKGAALTAQEFDNLFGKPLDITLGDLIAEKDQHGNILNLKIENADNEEETHHKISL